MNMPISPLAITPESLADEMASLQRKLAAGIDTLRQVGDFDYGVTPREEIWRDGKVVLYRFVGERKPTAKVPLLVCYALVNRPYMIDLQADRSLVRGLIERGHDVYVIDWGYVDRSDRFLTLEDYIERFLGGAIDALRERSGQAAVNLAGVCQGGAFALCYAALHPEKVRNLITMVTAVDFHTEDNMLSNWNRDLDVDLLVDTLGNIPADMMNFTYLMLKPWRLFVQKYVGMVDLLDDPKAMRDFLRMEQWIFDSPDQAGEAFREFDRQFFQENRLMNGSVRIGENTVDLGFVDMPVLNIYAEHDHLVPPDASRALREIVGSEDYSEHAFRGGHIGIYVSGRAQAEIPGTISDWLRAR